MSGLPFLGCGRAKRLSCLALALDRLVSKPRPLEVERYLTCGDLRFGFVGSHLPELREVASGGVLLQEQGPGAFRSISTGCGSGTITAMAAPAITRLTDDAYFELEVASPMKHQLWCGELFAMAGGSPAHNVISVNVASALRGALRGGPCKVMSADQRLGIGAAGTYLYADVVIACGPLSLGKHDTLLNPTMLVEVLSDSTEAFDRGDKLDAYTRVSSLQQVVLVSSKRRHVELYSREADGAFRRTALSGAGTLALTSLAVGLPLAEIYEGAEDLMVPQG